MAQKPTTTSNLDSDVAKELEQALDFDLTGGDDDLDIAASMEDLEAQIAQAADELARESNQEKPAASAKRAGCRAAERSEGPTTARQRMAPGSRRNGAASAGRPVAGQ